MYKNSPEVQEIIDCLQLIPHPEGGYFRETYRSGAEPMASKGQTDDNGALIPDVNRNIMTSIYCMLTQQNNFFHWVENKSDHVHYYHSGGSIQYHLVHACGKYETATLGGNLRQGEVMQLIVKGNVYKCAVLNDKAEYSLIGEGVAPGFDFRDFHYVTQQELQDKLNNEQLFQNLKQYLKDEVNKEKHQFDEFYDNP